MTSRKHWQYGMLGFAGWTVVLTSAYYAFPQQWLLFVLGAFSAVLLLLALLRLSGVATRHRRTAGRERILRKAATSLGAATSVPEVARVVGRVVAELIAEARHDTVLLVPEDDGPVLLRGDGERRSAPTEAVAIARAVTATDVGRPVSAADLPDDLARGLDGLPSALVCPLAVRNHPVGDSTVGALIVSAEEQDLLAVQESLHTLAAQAELAVERIALSRKVTERNGGARFRTLVQHASDVILVLDDTDQIRYASPSADRVLGYPSTEGTLLTDLVPPESTRDVVEALARMRERDDRDRREHWRMSRVDHSSIEVEVGCVDLRDDATVGGLVLTLRDVTEQRMLERDLTYQALHDPLTGMANRVLFQDRIARALAKGRRQGTLVGVLFVDVDDFKVVNDVHGHSVGNELLVAVSLRLATTVRASDTAARLGGDEFALLIENAMTPQDIETIADHVVGAFSEPFRLSVGQVSIYASVGIATTEDSFDSTELLAHADLALYQAKTAGKRQWRRFRPVLQEGIAERHELQEGLDQAPIETSFSVLYQPIVNLASGETFGFEALVRWPHAVRGMVLPEEFIGLAEESGRIVPLGAWVLQQAAAEAVRWQSLAPGDPAPESGPPRPCVSVNVSPRQFWDTEFVDTVRRTLDVTGLPPSSLLLELTETVLTRRDDRVLADMRALTELGIRIAIDDFGTGYASLSYLREFPISLLKIDKSFIDELGHSPQQFALVEGITHLADTLGLTVVAEGIEDPTQRELLMTMGCPLGQGFLFARPFTADQAESSVLTPVTGHLTAGILRI